MRIKIAAVALRSVQTQNAIARDALDAAKIPGLPADMRQSFINLSAQVSENAARTARAASQLIR